MDSFWMCYLNMVLILYRKSTQTSSWVQTITIGPMYTLKTDHIEWPLSYWTQQNKWTTLQFWFPTTVFSRLFFAAIKWIIFDAKTIRWLECQTCDFRHNISHELVPSPHCVYEQAFLVFVLFSLLFLVCLQFCFFYFSHVIALVFMHGSPTTLCVLFSNQNESIDSIFDRSHEVHSNAKRHVE